MVHIINPVILCGGSGTRLWPLSTPERPKQFLSLTSENSMIQETALRFETSKVGAVSFLPPLIIGSERHSSLLEKEFPGGRIILEPFGRNSAPAVAAACLALAPEDILLILPADHHIQDVEAFHKAIELGVAAAKNGAIITFGITPTNPATGYGYIKAKSEVTDAPLQVEAFVEKPDRETAETYLAAKCYYWNAGIFLFQAHTMLKALHHFAPEVLHGVDRAMDRTTATKTMRLDPEPFNQVPSVSIDCAVMEQASNIKTVPVSMGWSDVGGYRSLHDLLTIEASENYTRGPVVVDESKGLYIHSEGPTVSVKGASDLVIVATPNDVMITSIKDESAAKRLGSTVRQSPHTIGLSDETASRAKSWLWTALNTWAKAGWDDENGGFFEQLNSDGRPRREVARRSRVQARQVFSFAKAQTLSWGSEDDPSSLVAKGIQYIDRYLRHTDGGFVHSVDDCGGVIDDRRDLYDHAFIILAGVSAKRATNSELALRVANDALSYIDQTLKDEVYGGWFESSQFETPRHPNPHMHLLEAMLAHYKLTGSAVALDHAAEIVRLFETRFFNPATDTMGERFTKDWRLTSVENLVVFESGHHYEWASLLHQYESVTGHDTLSWRRRLIRKADRAGVTSSTGFAMNEVRANGEVVNSNSRLWHQLEMLRAYLYHPELASRSKCEGVLDAIFDHYFSAAPIGCWIDEIDNKSQPVSNHIPASMLYHAVTAFTPLIDSKSARVQR